MARAKQQEFQGEGFAKPGDIFGGSLLKKGNARSKRPLASKFAIHVVLRANRSALRLPGKFGRVQQTLRDTSKRHGVRLYEDANVGNHIHLLIKLPNLRAWAPFIRELSGRIALICGGEKFWRWRPYTRIVRGWKRAYRMAREYVQLNQLQADGHIDRRQIKTLKDLRAVFSG